MESDVEFTGMYLIRITSDTVMYHFEKNQYTPTSFPANHAEWLSHVCVFQVPICQVTAPTPSAVETALDSHGQIPLPPPPQTHLPQW